MQRPAILIVTPAAADPDDGHGRTAQRWAGFLADDHEVGIACGWDGRPADLLIALHARLSGEAVETFAAARPDAPIALLLTGTDVYHDIHIDTRAIAALGSATRIVVRQPQALFELEPGLRDKAEVIFPSAPFEARLPPRADRFEVISIAPLCACKDPVTPLEAVLRLPAASGVHLVQVGRSLDFECEAALRAAHTPRHEWLGELPHHVERELLRRMRALVVASRLEGGSQAIAEAVMSDVRVIASRVSGNLGMLGEDYGGYFTPGDADALAGLLLRVEHDRAFRLHLKAQCQALRTQFDPDRERLAVRALAQSLLARRG